jgi:ubiquinone/menaquinone biosynthesis C-methylase UbiE
LDQDAKGSFTAEPLSSVSGIDCYVQDEYYWRELPQDEAMTLTELARRIGWRKAVLTLQNKGLIRYITDPIRVRFLDFLPMKKGARVLDLGAGWGSLSIQVAKRFPSSTVYALDMTLEGLLFLDIVKKQENLSNLRIAKVAANRIPLADESMDVVLMIGVLEWVGESISTLEPLASQLAVLGEVRRVLKKGGKLVLGIENRYSYKYLRGKPEHSHIRFGSVLPKGFVSFYSRRFLHKEYRTYIYSRGEYQKLLGQAGYGNLHFYGAYPDYRFPRVISDLESMHEFWRDAHAPGSSLLKRLPNGFVRLMVPSYFIFAEK